MPISGIQSSSTNLWLQPTTASKNLWVQPTTASNSLAITNYAREDTNQDGVVSPAELLAYELSHPAAVFSNRSRPVAPTNAQEGGALAQTGSSIRSTDPDLYAPPASTSRKMPATSYDPGDVNQDGVVSPAERLAYELSHPAAASLDRSRAVATAYTQRGGLQVQTGSKFFDLNA